MDPSTKKQTSSDIVIVGGDSSIHYLLQRFADRIGYAVRVEKSSSSAESVLRSKPAAVIFPSMEILEGAQSLIVDLTDFDIPIIVCSSVFDQEKTQELGADYCLLHPLAFDSFSSTLNAAVQSQTESRADREEARGNPPINPV